MTSNHYDRRKQDKGCSYIIVGSAFLLGTLLYIGILSLESYNTDNYYDNYLPYDLYKFGNDNNHSITNLYNLTGSISNHTDTNDDYYNSSSKYDIMSHPVTIIYILSILSCLGCCLCIYLDL